MVRVSAQKEQTNAHDDDVLPELLNRIRDFIRSQISASDRAHFHRFVDARDVPAVKLIALVGIHTAASVPIVVA